MKNYTLRSIGNTLAKSLCVYCRHLLYLIKFRQLMIIIFSEKSSNSVESIEVEEIERDDISTTEHCLTDL
jgi:hypothetical protein